MGPASTTASSRASELLRTQEEQIVLLEMGLGNPTPPIHSSLVCADADVSFELDLQSIDWLDRFRRRTIFTLEVPFDAVSFCNSLMKLAFGVCERYPLKLNSLFLSLLFLLFSSLTGYMMVIGPLPDAYNHRNDSLS